MVTEYGWGDVLFLQWNNR